MRNIFNLIFLLIICAAVSCRAIPDKIPEGEWRYKLIVNGVEAGTAVITNKLVNGKYETSSEYKMELGGLETVTKDKVTETKDFSPVKLESYNKVVSDGQIHETNIVSTFNGREVTLNYDNNKLNYKLDRDFIIDGNYFLAKCIEAKFQKGFEVTNYVYNPSVELETPIKVTTRVEGYKEIIINNESEMLIHLVQSIENIKDNVELFIDNKCILKKGVIRMMNLKIELIISD